MGITTETTATAPVRVGFALEYSLGHITHSDNLKAALRGNPGIIPTYIDLPYHDTPGWYANLPGVRSNWSLRASIGAYLGLRKQWRHLDALFFHTQVTSLLSTGLMRHRPSIVSLDATPLQYDTMGTFYQHSPGNGRIEGLKKRLNERAFHAARHLVTWSQWAKDSLVADYAVPADKVTVIPPGIDTTQWNFPRTANPSRGPIHLLFVGGDFARKGGDTLLAAFASLDSATWAGLHLHIVTKSRDLPPAASLPNVTLYHDLAPNTPALLSLFRQADLFVFPTRGDCLPLAVMEALAAGLPVVTTAVGALPEAVTHGETGWVVPQDDANALAEAIALLGEDALRRVQMGRAARQAALQRFDSATNYRRLMELIRQQAGK